MKAKIDANPKALEDAGCCIWTNDNGVQQFKRMAREMCRPILLIAALAVSSFSPNAYADTAYNFTLTSSDGYAGGSGSFALNVPPPSTGTVTYSLYGDPYDLGNQVDSFVVNYTPPPGGYFFPSPIEGLGLIQFTNGMLTGLSEFVYRGYLLHCSYYLGLNLTGYSYGQTCATYPQLTYSDAGTITVIPAAVAATPEPSALALLGTAVLGSAAVVRRRNQYSKIQAS